MNLRLLGPLRVWGPRTIACFAQFYIGGTSFKHFFSVSLLLKNLNGSCPVHQIIFLHKTAMGQTKAFMNHYCMLYIREREEQSSYLLQIRFDVKADKNSLREHNETTCS